MFIYVLIILLLENKYFMFVLKMIFLVGFLEDWKIFLKIKKWMVFLYIIVFSYCFLIFSIFLLFLYVI